MNQNRKRVNRRKKRQRNQAVLIASILVIIGIFVGIKFITASPEAKAEIKKTAVIYVIGAVLLFAAGGILGIIQSLSQNVK